MAGNSYYILKETGGGATITFTCSITSSCLSASAYFYTAPECDSGPTLRTLASDDALHTSQTVFTIDFSTNPVNGWTCKAKCTDYLGVQDGTSITIRANPEVSGEESLSFILYATKAGESDIYMDPVLRLKNPAMIQVGTPTVGNDYHLGTGPHGAARLELICIVESGLLQLTGIDPSGAQGPTHTPRPWELIPIDTIHTKQQGCTLAIDTSQSTPGWSYEIEYTDHEGQLRKGSVQTVTADPKQADQSMQITITASPSGGSPLQSNVNLRLKSTFEIPRPAPSDSDDS